MIGLDTNVLVRYFAQDDPKQSWRATEIIEGLTESNPGFVSLVTVIETVWVLTRIYALPAQEIAKAIERMLQADTLAVQNEGEVFVAVVALRTGRGSFADALIGALAAWAGCETTYTFDRKATRLAGFTVL